MPAFPSLPARAAGYGLILAILLLCAGLAWFLLRESRHAGRVLRLHFPEIATLAQEDPVVERGVTVGKVREIRLEGNRAIVEIELFHHRFLPRDTRFLNFSHSLMGARKVWIEPGGSRVPLDEGVVHEGLFVPGLAEMLHRANDLLAAVIRLREESDRVFGEGGALSPAAVQARLEEAMHGLAALSRGIESARLSMLPLLSGGGAGAGAIAGRIGPLESGMDSARARMEAALASAESGLRSLERMLAHSERLAAAIRDPEGAGALLQDATLYEELRRAVATLEAAAVTLRGGVPENVKIRPRIRLRRPE